MLKQSADSIIITTDLSRIPAPEETAAHSRGPIKCLGDIFYHLLRVPVSMGSGLPVGLTSELTTPCFTKEFYDALGHHNGPTHMDWAASQIREPNQTLLELFKKTYGHAFVIGICLGPLYKKTLQALGVPWLDISLHPARYLQDLLCEFSGGTPEIRSKLRKYAIPEYVFQAAAARETARYTTNIHSRAYWLPDNCTLLFKRRPDELPPILKDGSLLTLLDCQTQLKGLADESGAIFFADKYTLTPEERTLLADFGIRVVPNKCYNFRNSYVLLTHPQISLATGFGDKRMAEAALFDKTCRPLHPEMYMEQDPLFPSIPVDRDCFTPAFWRDLLGAPDENGSPLPGSEYSREFIPNLRITLRGGWSDYEDSRSISDALKLGLCEYRLDAMDDYVFVKELAVGSPEQSPDIPAHKPSDYAIFAGGDGNVVVHSIVALKSFANNLHNENLYFVTDTQALSEENKELLAHFAITPLDTLYARDFAVGHIKHSSAAAYNQLIGPELLWELGFKYSIGIQADAFCLCPFDPQHIFAQTEYFSGTNSAWETACFCFTDPDAISKKFSISKQRLYATTHVNPGVLFMNNHRLRDMGFAAAAKRVYETLGGKNLMFEEESILNFMYLDDPSLINFIDTSYNTLLAHPVKAKQIRCVHFDNKPKPWMPMHRSTLADPKRVLFAGLWRKAARDTLGAELYEKYIKPNF